MDGGSLHCTGDRDQDLPHGKEMHKSKILSGESLKIAVKRSEAKSKEEKERYKHLNAELQRIAEMRKPSSAITAKEQRKTIEWERLEISSRKLEIPREHFTQRWAR